MHPVSLPPEIVERVRARRGRVHPFESLSPRRTAFVVIDMQNAFCAPGAAIEVPVARSIVRTINRLAAAVRSSGGMVVWVQMTIKDAADWPVFLSALVDKENSTRILAELRPGSEGHKLWPECAVEPVDLLVPKNRFSAFLPSACALAGTLKSQGIEFRPDQRHLDRHAAGVGRARCTAVCRISRRPSCRTRMRRAPTASTWRP